MFSLIHLDLRYTFALSTLGLQVTLIFTSEYKYLNNVNIVPSNLDFINEQDKYSTINQQTWI